MAVTVSYDPTSNVILVDTSYYIFYRYNATLKWYTYQQKTPIDYTAIHNDTTFVESFKKHVKADIVKLKRRWSVPDANLMFCLDVPRDTIWRHRVYPVYKMTREQSASFNRAIFPIFYKFLEDTLKYTTLTAKSLEADDIVYLTSQHLLNTKGFAHNIIVISNDNDYLQMRGPNVEIHNMNAKNSDLAKRSVGDPRVDMLIKVLRGDPSDNITQVCTKMGVKTATKLAELTDAEIIALASSKGAECLSNFMRNRMLISFEHIPHDLAQTFLSKYTFCAKK